MNDDVAHPFMETCDGARGVRLIQRTRLATTLACGGLFVLSIAEVQHDLPIWLAGHWQFWAAIALIVKDLCGHALKPLFPRQRLINVTPWFESALGYDTWWSFYWLIVLVLLLWSHFG